MLIIVFTYLQPKLKRKHLGGALCLISEDFRESKIIILGTRSSLKLLSESSCWLIYDTFEVVPSIMRQLFSIHGLIGNEIVVYCLMSSKNKEADLEFFYELYRCACEFNIVLNPKRVVSDFEKASVAACRSFFPSAVYTGCLFHCH